MTDRPKAIPDAELEMRKTMSFAQAEGAEALPGPLIPKYLPKEARLYMWAVIYDSLRASTEYTEFSRNGYFDDPWKNILQAKFIARDHRPSDEFVNDATKLTAELKRIILEGTYVQTLDFVQWLIRIASCPEDVPGGIKWALEAGRAAYAVVENTIIPTASEQEATTIISALAAARNANLPGAYRHLREAAQKLTQADYSGSIRESIHSVESAAKIIAPESIGLGPALTALEKGGKIHPAMRTSFANLYGFTSDEKGIRHALLEKDSANVDEADAQFMLGACAAFVSYLLHRARR